MLEIRGIHIDNIGSGCVTDNPAPEVSFSLRSDIPGTFLRNGIIQLGDRVFPCGKAQTGIVLDGLDLKPFSLPEPMCRNMRPRKKSRRPAA